MKRILLCFLISISLSCFANQSPNYIKENNLIMYPKIPLGKPTPLDLWRYYGKGDSSFSSTSLPMAFDKWAMMLSQQKNTLMTSVNEYMSKRYFFSDKVIPHQFMSGGKPIMHGPVAILPKGIFSYEALAALSAAEIKQKDLFPFKPLAHPLHNIAHMVFPKAWIEKHPEHDRLDVDMDIPQSYLPEFPSPMYLTTHKELGDITKGKEITFDNYFDVFNGLLTPEQMEGLKELLRPTPTTWFNQTSHRITQNPTPGVACFSCHVNGHTNGAFALGPDSRPNLARLRTKTPSMRGNYNMQLLSSKRSIRSMDHFAAIEEYFDGDPGMQQAIGARGAKIEITNRMGDFNAILDFPPAPKLDVLNQLIAEKATKSELRGEKIFWGKGKCSQCHNGPAFEDGKMHDLQVENFYKGRPEGPIKTFSLRGIKDSPPYLHDGRLPTLDDSVEFFNIILNTKLTKQDKVDLRNYLLCL